MDSDVKFVTGSTPASCVQPNQETVTTPDLSSLSSPLIDTERNLGLLLGLHASYLALSTPLSRMEIECASEFLYLTFMKGVSSPSLCCNHASE